MKTDLLLEKFNEEAIDMSKVVGGGPKIVGCSQDGGNSYFDVQTDDGEVHCGVFIAGDDGSTWYDMVSEYVLIQ